MFLFIDVFFVCFFFLRLIRTFHCFSMLVSPFFSSTICGSIAMLWPVWIRRDKYSYEIWYLSFSLYFSAESPGFFIWMNTGRFVGGFSFVVKWFTIYRQRERKEKKKLSKIKERHIEWRPCMARIYFSQISAETEGSRKAECRMYEHMFCLDCIFVFFRTKHQETEILYGMALYCVMFCIVLLFCFVFDVMLLLSVYTAT